MVLRLSEGLGLGCGERRDCDIARFGDRLPQCLDALKFVHGLCREVGRSAAGAGPHRNALYNQEIRTLAEASCHVLQLNFGAAALGTCAFN